MRDDDFLNPQTDFNLLSLRVSFRFGRTGPAGSGQGAHAAVAKLRSSLDVDPLRPATLALDSVRRGLSWRAVDPTCMDSAQDLRSTISAMALGFRVFVRAQRSLARDTPARVQVQSTTAAGDRDQCDLHHIGIGPLGLWSECRRAIDDGGRSSTTALWAFPPSTWPRGSGLRGLFLSRLRGEAWRGGRRMPATQKSAPAQGRRADLVILRSPRP